MKYIFGILFLLGSVSCIKESQTQTYGYLYNSTNHKIYLSAFKNGSINNGIYLILKPSEIVKIADNNEKGLKNGGGFTALWSTTDSIQIVFDSNLVTSHYIITPFSCTERYYLYSSERNLYNYHSYKYMTEDLSENSRKNTYTYTFTEDDYLYAKNK